MINHWILMEFGGPPIFRRSHHAQTTGSRVAGNTLHLTEVESIIRHGGLVSGRTQDAELVWILIEWEIDFILIPPP